MTGLPNLDEPGAFGARSTARPSIADWFAGETMEAEQRTIHIHPHHPDHPVEQKKWERPLPSQCQTTEKWL